MLGFYLTLIDEQSDKEKFVEIYNTYRDMMFCKAMSILHNKELAEEAVQESFLKIAKNISKISTPVCSKTASFVVIIVRNTSYNSYKKEKNSEAVSLDDDILTTDIIMPDIEKVIFENGFDSIVKIISDMDKIYSDALKLKYIYGYSNGEIADMLDISQKNAEMRIYRGKQILKSKLEEDDYVIK